MVPLSEFGTIGMEANLYEAALALEKSQKKYEQGISGHRILLITDNNGCVVGFAVYVLWPMMVMPIILK